MPGIDEFMAQVPVEQLASQLGVDEQTAAKTARAAGAVLLGGMEANAQDPAGAASLEQALSQHDPGVFDSGVDLGKVDTGDGAKIVRNVFGDNEGQVVDALGGQGGIDSGLIKKALPLLAPLVLAFLAKSLGGRGQGAQSGGGGLGDVLGGMLGGGSGGGGGLGDVLGGMLGGGGAGGLGDILGGLLGGGKR
jgi:hypothetical protein